MSLEKLLEKINEKEEVLVKQVEKETKTEIDAITQNFDVEIQAYSNSEWQKAKENIKSLQQKEDINLDIYKRKMMLDIKRNILEDVYVELVSRLKKIDLDEYKSWIFKNIDNVDFLNKKGELLIGIGNFDGKIKDEFLEDVINFIKSKKLDAVKVEFKKDIDFGFKYIEESVILDFSLEAIISEIKQVNELKVSNILFN